MIVHLNGFDLSYDRDGQGTPVVYVHGGFASLASYLTPPESYTWGWERDFTPTFDFIEYERRGCYRSSCPESGYDLPNQVRDLETLLDHLGLRSVHLIGSSAGGPISLLYAATYPQRIRTLILAGTGLTLFPLDDPLTQVVQELLARLAHEGPKAAFAARPAGVETHFGVLWEQNEMRERGTLEDYQARQQTLDRKVADIPETIRLRYFAAELCNMGAYIGFDLEPYAGQVKAPTLVVHGTHDREVPSAQGEALARVIQGARLVSLASESHSLIIRSPTVRQTVMGFMHQNDQEEHG